MHFFSCIDLPIPNTAIHRVEQLAPRYQQTMALDFKFVLGVGVRDPPPPDPENEVDNDTRSPNVEGISAQETVQHMEDTANYDNPFKTEEADYIDKDDNQLDSTDGVVLDT